MARYCIECGTALAAGAHFCGACGAHPPEGGRLVDLRAALEALKHAPDAVAALHLGHLFLVERDEAAALEAFALAGTTDPQLGAAHLAQAVVLLQREELAQARTQLEQVVAIGGSPDLLASARAYLAILLLDEFDIRGADTQLAQAEHEDPASFLVMWKRGEYYYRLGMYPDAVRVLNQAVRLPAPSKSSGIFVAHLLEQSREKAKRSFVRQPLLPQWAATWRRRIAG